MGSVKKHLAAELNKKMNDPLWLESTGLQAKTLAKEYFDVEVCANKFIQILEATSCHAQIDIEKIAPSEFKS